MVVCVGMRMEWVVGLVSGLEVDFRLLYVHKSVGTGDGWLLDERTRGTLGCDMGI